MKLMFVSVAMILATSLADEVIYSNPFDASHVYMTVFPICYYYRVADDFTPISTADVEFITIWTISITTNPSAMEVVFYSDGDPGPGNVLWTQLATDVTWTETGLVFAGYDIYICEIELPNADYFTVNGSSTYWMTAYRSDGFNLYCLIDDEAEGMECYRDVGSGWQTGSSTGYAPTDMFNLIEGTLALDRTTWGMVKTLFH